MNDSMPYPKKLIEVALPLEAIKKASAHEKSIWHAHPSTLLLWRARLPLAAARAMTFAQMVADLSAHPVVFPIEKAQEKERQRLFRIIEDLMLWENTTNDTLLQRARDEIWQSWRRTCAENVRYYDKWLRDEAEKRIGHPGFEWRQGAAVPYRGSPVWIGPLEGTAPHGVGGGASAYPLDETVAQNGFLREVAALPLFKPGQ